LHHDDGSSPVSPTPARALGTRLTLPGAPPGPSSVPAPAPATPADVPGRRKEPREPQALPVFRRLAALVPPGSWPAVLPLTLDGFRRPRPLALGIHDRLAALLPEAEHRALRKALA